MNELEKLCKLKLKTPTGLRKFIFNETDYQTRKTIVSRFVETIEIWNGKLLLRTFGFKSSTRKCRYQDMQIMEVQRSLEGYSKACQKNVYANMAGHGVVYDNSNLYYSYDTTFYIYKKWQFTAYKKYDVTTMIKKLNIQYCQYQNKLNKSCLSFFDYICLYRKYPQIELLVKMELSQFISGIRYLDIKQKTLAKIFKIKENNCKYLKHIDISELLILRKHENHIETLQDILEIKKIKRNKHYNILPLVNKKVINYYNSLSFLEQNDYNDYLGFIDKLHIPISNKILIPKCLMESHDKFQQMVETVKNELVNTGIFKTYCRNLKYCYSNRRYVIIPVENGEQLDRESKVLKHCVHQYKEQLSNGETNIMLIRHIRDITYPLATLEFSNNRVIQCRGYRNNVHNNPLPEEIKQFVNAWCKDKKLKSCFKGEKSWN